jgi:hypothetical protein
MSFSVVPVFSQQEGTAPSYRVEFTKEGPRFFQRIPWEKVEHAYRYEVIIERESEGAFVPAQRENYFPPAGTTAETQPFVEVSLAPGNYRYRVRVYDLLDRFADESDWGNFSVLRALQPEISALEPDAFYFYDGADPRLVLTGHNLYPESEIVLIPRRDFNGAWPEENPAPVFPRRTEAGPGGESLTLFFDPAALSKNRYDIYVKNPGGLWTRKGAFRVASVKTDILVSAGYSPFFPLYGFEKGALNAPVYPLGLGAGLAVIPRKPKGAFGFELAAHWNYLESGFDDYTVDTHIAGLHAGLLYQKYFTPALALNLRLGAGVSSLLNFAFEYNGNRSSGFNTWYISAGGGVSLKWFVYRGFFLDAGVNLRHFFAGDMPSGALLPSLQAGLRF